MSADKPADDAVSPIGQLAPTNYIQFGIYTSEDLDMAVIHYLLCYLYLLAKLYGTSNMSSRCTWFQNQALYSGETRAYPQNPDSKLLVYTLLYLVYALGQSCVGYLPSYSPQGHCLLCWRSASRDTSYLLASLLEFWLALLKRILLF